MAQEQMTVRLMSDTFQHELGQYLSRNEIRQLFYFLAGKYLGWTKTTVHLQPDFVIPGEKIVLFSKALDRLARHEPIEYITGTSFFNGNEFLVNQSVLIPRPETEELCNMLVQDLSPDKYKEVSILDIGTGSGCIAIDLKKRLPYAKVTAVDKSEKALEIARQNANRHETELSLCNFDVLDHSIHGLLDKFDVVVSNPPYVTTSEKSLMKPNVLEFEPQDAIFVYDDDPLIFYRSIITLAFHHLYRPGWVYLEINERFGQEIAKILHDFGFEKIDIIKDLSDKDRFVRALLVNPMEDVSYWYTLGI